MERLRKYSTIPHCFTRLFRSNSAPLTNNRNKALCTSRATQLELHDFQRVCLPPMPTDLSRNDQKRWYIFDELITHEQNYLDALHKLQYIIFNTLTERESFIAQDTLQTIFGTHQRICKLHQFVQVLLEQCVKEWPVSSAAGWMIMAMVEQPAFLHYYDMFIKNHKHTVEIYTEECINNYLFAWFVTGKLREIGEQRTFKDYFIMPVQHMPQLLLQVKELAKNTPEAHPDRTMMDRCIRRITYLGEQLNSASGKGELVETVLHAIDKWDAAKSRTFTHDRSQCLLLHCETLSEMFKDGIGQRIVLLLSDRLVCAKLPVQKSKSDRSSKQRTTCKLQTKAIGAIKWVIPLQELRVKWGEQSESRQGSAESLASLESIRDFATLSSVRDLMSTLHRSHDTLNVDTCSEELNKIWSKVLSSDESQDDANMIHINPWQGKPRVLMAETADAKKEWCYTIRLAQLALRAENSPGWWNSAVYAPYEALFSKTFEAGDFAGAHRVTGACCFVPNTESQVYSNELFRVWSQQQHVLWFISKDKISSMISLYTHDRKTNSMHARATIDLPKVQVSSIVYVPEGQVGDTVTDTVWVSTRTRILIYSATYPMIDTRLKSIRIKGTPNRLVYHDRRVFVGTLNERLLIFSLKADGVWDLQTPQQCRCGTIAAMCVIDTNIYMAIRAQLLVFDNTVGAFAKQLSSPCGCKEDKRFITLLKHSVHGLWVARQHSAAIALYHADHHKHLLDVNVDVHVARFMAEITDDTLQASVYVKSMQIIENVLWVGTNVGLVLSMQLPQLANVPIMVDQMTVAYHGHLADVKVILPLPSLRVRQDVEPELIDVDPLLLDNLYKNTRNPARDFSTTKLGIAELDTTFIDALEDLNVGFSIEAHQSNRDAKDGGGGELAPDTASIVKQIDASQDGGNVYTSASRAAKEGEDKPGKEKATDSSTWAPNSMLIVTGGHGYIKRQHNVDLNTSLQGSSRSHSTSNVAELSGSWKLNSGNEKENFILWEKRLN